MSLSNISQFRTLAFAIDSSWLKPECSAESRFFTEDDALVDDVLGIPLEVNFSVLGDYRDNAHDPF